eukprot:5418529-Amphidinium_carterae.2
MYSFDAFSNVIAPHHALSAHLSVRKWRATSKLVAGLCGLPWGPCIITPQRPVLLPAEQAASDADASGFSSLRRPSGNVLQREVLVTTR